MLHISITQAQFSSRNVCMNVSIFTMSCVIAGKIQVLQIMLIMEALYLNVHHVQRPAVVCEEPLFHVLAAYVLSML